MSFFKHEATPQENTMHLGFHKLVIQFNGKVSVYSAWAKETVADNSGVGPAEFDSLDEALKKVKEWSVFMWNHNNRKELIESYGLSREFVTDFLGYVWEGI